MPELDALIADELQFVFHDGAVYTKAMDLEAHRGGTIRIAKLDFSEREIRRFGEGLAVVTVKAQMAGAFEGQAFEGTFRYLRAWVRRPDGRWQIAGGSVAAL